jgi:hydroxymethylbilane synthase
VAAIPERVVIASRESALAMWQAHHIRDRLTALYPGLVVEILGMTTQGDRMLGSSLAKIGGKGLFVKELEAALADGRADIAVHSMKDVPAVLPEGFALAAITAREDPRDAFVSHRYAAPADLPVGATVGTSSLRRESQLKARFPGLSIEPLRGNVGTRLARLDEGRFDAVILAAAGLKRLGHGARIRALLSPEESLPAAGQGALGIECRSDRADVLGLLAPFIDGPTSACVRAERAVSAALGASCQLPLAAYAEPDGDAIRLRGCVASPDGTRIVRAECSGATAEPEATGHALARQLRAGGADAILAAVGAAR